MSCYLSGRQLLCKLSWQLCMKAKKKFLMGTHQRIINLHLDRIALFVYTICKFQIKGYMSFTVHICVVWQQCCALLFRRSRFLNLGFLTLKAAGNQARCAWCQTKIGLMECSLPTSKAPKAMAWDYVGFGENYLPPNSWPINKCLLHSYLQ